MNFISYHENNPDSVYFLNSAQGTYINNFFMSMFFYACVKFIQLLCYLTKNSYHIARRIYKNIRKSSKKWSLFSMLIEPNITILVFYSANQFLVNSYFNFNNKLNLIFCIFMLFITLLYSTCFYPLIYSI